MQLLCGAADLPYTVTWTLLFWGGGRDYYYFLFLEVSLAFLGFLYMCEGETGASSGVYVDCMPDI